jgi:hypothetical protein
MQKYIPAPIYVEAETIRKENCQVLKLETMSRNAATLAAHSKIGKDTQNFELNV